MDWKKIPKIDAHVHLLPEERRQGFIQYQGENCAWAKADLNQYMDYMDEYNIKKAILHPTNDPYMYYSTRKTNEFLAEIVNKYPDKFLAFADLNFNGAYILDREPDELEYAIREFGLSGLKIHPNNLNLDADDLRLVPILRKAADLKIPVMYHSNPSMTGFHDNSAPDKINKMIKVFPDIEFITAHMGGMKYLDAWSGCTWVDISFVLPELVDLYGIEQTNRILRMFGPDRLIFGTDYPERAYEEYCNILNEMDFTGEEVEKIAYGNISDKLGHIISDYSEEDISNTKDIKGFMLDKYEITKSERLLFKKQLLDINIFTNKYKNTLNKKYKLESLVNNLLIYFILNGVILSMQLLSGYFVLKGTISIGTFFATQLYVSHFWTPVEYLFIIRNEYLTAKPAINSFVDFMDVEVVDYNDSIIESITLNNIQCLSNKNKVLNKKISMNFNNEYINIISGDNGTGKTTIIESILNYTDRYKGDVYINDELLGDLSYSDIVYIPANYLISEHGILSDKVNFSSGQKKKAQIELSISTNKSVYIIDEPTNFLDKENKMNIVDIINKLYKENKIIILITHDDEILEKLINSNINYLEKQLEIETYLV